LAKSKKISDAAKTINRIKITVLPYKLDRITAVVGDDNLREQLGFRFKFCFLLNDVPDAENFYSPCFCGQRQEIMGALYLEKVLHILTSDFNFQITRLARHLPDLSGPLTDPQIIFKRLLRIHL